MRCSVLVIALLAAALEITPATAQVTDGSWSLLPYLPLQGELGPVLFTDVPRARLLLFGGFEYWGLATTIWARPIDGSSRWAPLPSVGAPTYLGPGVAAILDPARDRLLIWNGYTGTLWTVSLGSPLIWTSRQIPNGPDRSAAAAAFDAAHRRMLMFGGMGPDYANTADVWALPLDDDDASWSQLAVTGPTPEPRDGASAIVDVAHDRLVIIGGRDFATRGGHLIQGDVWALSLSDTLRWTALFTSDTTAAQWYLGASAVLDSARNRMLMFGGDPGHAEVRALALDGSNQWSVAVPPDPVRGVVGEGDAVAYDAADDAFYEYGPLDQEARPTTWKLSLSPSPAWSAIEPNETRPQARFGQALAFDPVRNRWLGYGGRMTYYVYYEFPTEIYDDLWSVHIGDRPEWTKLTPAGGPPQARQDARMLFDPGGDRMILFGGQRTTDIHWPLSFGPGLGTPHFYGDTWSLALSDLLRWSPVLTAGLSPRPRDGHVMVLDSKRHRVLVFGGRDSLGGMNDLWALSLGGAPAWTQLAPAGKAPAERWQAVGCYDAAADRLVIAAGVDSANVYQDAFEVRFGADTLAWSALEVAGTPPAMGLYTRPYVFDAARRRILVFGDGTDHSAGLGSHWLSSWELDLSGPATWRALAPAGTGPWDSYGTAAACDSAGDRVLLAGGTDGERGEYTMQDQWLLSFGGLAAPVSLMLSSLAATSHRVTLDWLWTPTASGIAARVERCQSGAAWRDIGAAVVRGDHLTFVDSGAAPGIRYGYRLRATEDGVEHVVAETWVTIPGRLELVLNSPWPNPASTSALASFDLPRAGHAELTVFDVGGRRMEQHAIDAAQPGRYSIAVGRGFAPGVYLLRLVAESQSRTAKLCIVR